MYMYIYIYVYVYIYICIYIYADLTCWEPYAGCKLCRDNTERRTKITNFKKCTDSLTYPRGRGARDARPPWGPNPFIFMQFSAKKLQNNRLAHPLWELAPISGKSLIRHWHFSLLECAHLVIITRNHYKLSRDFFVSLFNDIILVTLLAIISEYGFPNRKWALLHQA